MIVFSLLNIEESGEAILASLPIIPRERARAKLLVMIQFSIIALLLMHIMPAPPEALQPDRTQLEIVGLLL